MKPKQKQPRHMTYDPDDDMWFNWGFSPNVGAPTVKDAKREALRKKEERRKKLISAPHKTRQM